jgi:hypothetical protein
VVAISSAVMLPHVAPRAGAGFAMAIGGLGALAIIVLGLMADRQVGRVGREGPAAREAFALELSRFLPSLVRSPAAPPPPHKPFSWPSFEGWLPRTTAAVVITLTACMLGAVLTARWLMSPERELRAPVAVKTSDAAREPEPLEPQNVAPPTPPPASTTSSSQPAGSSIAAPTAATEGRCSCRRASSLLWNEPIPRLGVLLLGSRNTGGPARKRLEIEIAAVNNGDEDLREIALGIEFFEQDPPPSQRKVSVAHRAVYFEGPLGPGKAIKWSVEARGNSFEVDKPIPGDIGSDGTGAAPLSAIAELLKANHRPVRLHGAMLLGYLGDPRARQATLELREAMREEEAPYLDRLVRALGDVRTCDLDVSRSGPRRTVKACVFNGSAEPQSKLALRVRGLDAKLDPNAPTAKPPAIVMEATFALAGELPPQAGVVTRAELELPGGSGEPAVFEAFADRADLLP